VPLAALYRDAEAYEREELALLTTPEARARAARKGARSPWARWERRPLRRQLPPRPCPALSLLERAVCRAPR